MVNKTTDLNAVITEAEKGHIGEIAVYVRDKAPRFSKKTTREDALNQFAISRIWDTEENTGVLIFVCLRKKVIEIIVDRGASKKIPDRTWGRICKEAVELIEKKKNADSGIEYAIEQVGEELRKAFPGVRPRNQIPDGVITN